MTKEVLVQVPGDGHMVDGLRGIRYAEKDNYSTAV